MITPELIAYIKGEQTKGVSKETIIALLKTQNWDDVDITEALNFIASQAQGHPNFITPASAYPVTVAKSHRLLKIILLAILIFIVITGGALAYASGYIVPLSKIFSQSVQSSHPNTTMGFDLNMNIDISGVKGASDISKTISGLSPIFNIETKGSVDTTDNKNPKSDFTLSIVSGTVEAAIEARSLNGSIYMNFTKAPDIGFISLKPIENKWIIIPQSGADSITNNPLITNPGLNPQFLNTLTDDQKQHIVDITNKASLIKITGNHLPQIEGGAVSFHFDFDLDRVGIISYIKDMTTYLDSINPNSSQAPVITDADYSKISDSLKDFHGEAWIGIFDHLPHKILVNFDITNPDMPDYGLVKFMTTLNYSDWNKPVVIEAPENPVTIEQLMSSVTGGTLDNFNTNAIPYNNNAIPCVSGPGVAC